MNKNSKKKNNNNNDAYATEWRRNRVVELYSEGRSQSQIAQILEISQPTVYRDLQYQRRQSRKKVRSYLDEHLPFEHNVCQVGLNKILRKVWDIAENRDSSYSYSEKAVLQALSLAKECYAMKQGLLADKTIIDKAIEFVETRRSQIEIMEDSVFSRPRAIVSGMEEDGNAQF